MARKRRYAPKRKSSSYKSFKAPRGKSTRGASRSQTVRIVLEAPGARSFPASYNPANGVLVGPSDPRPKRSRF